MALSWENIERFGLFPIHVESPMFLLNRILVLSVLSLFSGGLARAQLMTLEQAYDRALETDQTIAIAYEEAAKARLEPKLALTRLTPRLTSDAGRTRNGSIGSASGSSSTTTSSGGDRSALSAGLTLRQPILDLTVGPAYRAGKLTEISSLIDYQAAIRDTLLAVATAYYDLLTQQKLVKINTESLRLAKEQKELALAREQVGEVLKTDVLRAEVVVQRAQRTLVEAQNILKLRRSILANILNLGIEAPLEVAEPPAFPFANETLSSAVVRAQRLREVAQTAALTVDKRKAARDEIRAEYLPSISANAGLSTDATDGNGRNSTDNNWSFGLSLNMPWFTGGEKQLNIRKSEHEISQAQLDQERTAKQVAENVEEAWLQVRTLKQNLEGLKVEVAAAEENYHLLQNQYRAGEVNSLDVFQALTDLNTSRTDLTVQSYDYELALRDLARRTADFENERVQKALQKHQSTTPKR